METADLKEQLLDWVILGPCGIVYGTFTDWFDCSYYAQAIVDISGLACGVVHRVNWSEAMATMQRPAVLFRIFKLAMLQQFPVKEFPNGVPDKQLIDVVRTFAMAMREGINLGQDGSHKRGLIADWEIAFRHTFGHNFYPTDAWKWWLP